MRKTFIGALVVVLAAALATAAFASTPAAKKTEGTISSIDSHAMSFVLKSYSTSETIATNRSTQFKSAGKPIAFADLKTGERVHVTYEVQGASNLATMIDVVPAAPAKKPAR